MQQKQIALNSNTGLTFIKKTDVIYCSSDGAYTTIHIHNGKKITVTKNLKKVEASLNSKDFIRIHASHLININHIDSYLNQQFNCVKMSNGERLKVARSRKQGLFNCFVKI